MTALKTTLKDIKEFAKQAGVVDVTYYSNEALNELLKVEGFFNQVAYSAGVYGVSGAILQGAKSGKFYAITSRTNAIWMLL